MHRACRWLPAFALALTGPAGAQTAAPRPAAEARVPNFLGATGLLLIPSAYLQRDREVTAFAGTASLRGGAPRSEGRGADFTGGGVVVGIANRLEIGAAALSGSAAVAGRDTRFVGNARLSLFPETLLRPAVAVGVIDPFGALKRGPGWYLVTSKYLVRYFVRALTRQELAVKLHAGYGGGLYRQEPFGGVELFFPGRVSALAEVSAGKINAGGRISVGSFRATLGLFDFSRVGGGLSYTASWR